MNLKKTGTLTNGATTAKARRKSAFLSPCLIFSALPIGNNLKQERAETLPGAKQLI